MFKFVKITTPEMGSYPNWFLYMDSDLSVEQMVNFNLRMREVVVKQFSMQRMTLVRCCEVALKRSAMFP